MTMSARFLAISTLAVSLAPGLVACNAQSASQAAPAAAQEAAPAKVADNAAPAAKAEGASDHAECIYAEGEKDEGDHGCPHGPEAGGALAKNSAGHFGSPFTLADAKPLGATIDKGAGDAPILVEGEVEAVCQKKGCWMVIKDGTKQARVLMKDHGFAVPMDCRGKKAIIEGTLATRTFSEAQVKHLAKDGGDNPADVSGEKTEHVLTASGVEIVS